MIFLCYLHSIYILCIIYRLWRWYFWSYFQFARSKMQIWWKNEQIWWKIFLKVELRGVHGVRFFQVCNYLEILSWFFGWAGNQWLLHFFWHQDVTVTHYQPRARSFVFTQYSFCYSIRNGLLREALKKMQL